MCVIAIDYDGTITADFAKARIALLDLKLKGHYLVIWSSRNNTKQHGEEKDKRMQEMKDNLINNKIPYHEIDDGKNGKFHAQVYIDNKAWRFENNWDDIIKKIY